MTAKLTPAALAAAADAVTGTIESCRFERATLAMHAKWDRVPEWAAIIANCPNVRRSRRTVEDWALVAEFCGNLPRSFDLPYSFFSVARRYTDKLPEEELIDMLETVEGDRTINLESFGASLREAAKMDPSSPNLMDFLADEYQRLIDKSSQFDDEGDRATVEAIAAYCDQKRAERIPVR